MADFVLLPIDDCKYATLEPVPWISLFWMDFVLDCLFSIDSLKINYKSLFRELRLETHLTEYLTGSINTILCVSLQNYP